MKSAESLKGAKYQLADGRYLDLGSLYSVAFKKCVRSKYRAEAEDFAMWAVETAIRRSRKLKKNAHLNNVHWLFSEWLFENYREGKPSMNSERSLAQKRILCPMSLSKFENKDNLRLFHQDSHLDESLINDESDGDVLVTRKRIA